MALVGDKTWEKYLARLAQPFYAEDTAFFQDIDQAWSWVAEGAAP